MATPKCPYYAVIFTSVRTDEDEEGYAKAANRMFALAESMPGYLGRDTAPGINVSYWRDLQAVANWKSNVEHIAAQAAGIAKRYRSYRLRYCRVEEDVEKVIR